MVAAGFKMSLGDDRRQLMAEDKIDRPAHAQRGPEKIEFDRLLEEPDGEQIGRAHV